MLLLVGKHYDVVVLLSFLDELHRRIILARKCTKKTAMKKRQVYMTDKI